MTPLLSNPLYLFVIATSLLFRGCHNTQNKQNDQTGQSIALINGKPVTSHQFNSLVRQAAANTQGPVNLHAIGQKIIDQELAIQESLRLKLDRRPEILEKLELARREILAGAYADLIEQNIKPATFVEIQNYYQANPALFETRKIYQLRVFRLPLVLRENADFVATLKQSPTPQSLTEWLSKANVSYAVANEIRTAEQLPIASLGKLATAEKDQLVIFDTGLDITIYAVLNSVESPLNADQASARIENYLNNNKVRTELSTAIKKLESQSKIELYGEFSSLMSKKDGG